MVADMKVSCIWSPLVRGVIKNMSFTKDKEGPPLDPPLFCMNKFDRSPNYKGFSIYGKFILLQTSMLTLLKMDAVEYMCRMPLIRGLLTQQSVPVCFVKDGQIEPKDKLILKLGLLCFSHWTCQWWVNKKKSNKQLLSCVHHVMSLGQKKVWVPKGNQTHDLPNNGLEENKENMKNLRKMALCCSRKYPGLLVWVPLSSRNSI